MAKEQALKWITEESATLFDTFRVFPCTQIAKGIGESVYKVRGYMKELEHEGLVIKAHTGGYNKWSNHIYCTHGYRLTEKGAESPAYKARHRFWLDALSNPDDY